MTYLKRYLKRYLIDLLAGLIASMAVLSWTNNVLYSISSAGVVLGYGMWCWTDGMNTSEGIWKRVMGWEE